MIDPHEFDDFEDDGPDDGDALLAYAGELSRAVEAFGLEPLEPGTAGGVG